MFKLRMEKQIAHKVKLPLCNSKGWFTMTYVYDGLVHHNIVWMMEQKSRPSHCHSVTHSETVNPAENCIIPEFDTSLYNFRSVGFLVCTLFNTHINIPQMES